MSFTVDRKATKNLMSSLRLELSPTDDIEKKKQLRDNGVTGVKGTQ